jgi:hypothetical protein
MNNKERIDLLEKRIEAIEQKGKDVSVETSITPLEAVKQTVTELLKQTNIPTWAGRVAVDDDGEVWLYKNKPTTECDFWVQHTGEELLLISRISLNGANWEQCCWDISDLLPAQNQPKSTQDLSQNKGNQPNWENLLTYGDMRLQDRFKRLTSFRNNLNERLYKRVKPLLDRIDVLEKRNKDLIVDRDNYKDSFKHSCRVIEMHADKLKNLVEVPFELDKDGDVYFVNPDTCILFLQLKNMNINQNNINRILIQMKSEE